MTINGTALHDELERTTQRWPVATMAKVDKFVKAAVGDAAAVQSRRVLASAQAELANRAMRRFVELLYDETEGGANLWNVADSGRVLIPTPWSRTRHASYGLTDHGGRVLRSFFVWRLAQLPTHTLLLWCDNGQWFVNLHMYGSLEAAKHWLQSYGTVTADLWLEFNERQPRRGRK